MIEKIKNISSLEWAGMEAVIMIAIWLWDPYMGKLITFIFSPIFFAILIISLIADRLDPSKISAAYYRTLFWLAVVPLLIMMLHVFILDKL